jgi:hypothetical protein
MEREGIDMHRAALVRGSIRFGVLILITLVPLARTEPAHAQAQTYSLSGNLRSQIGAGVPLPITFTAIPDGKVVLPPGATVKQTWGPDPKAMILVDQPGALFGPQTTTVQIFVTQPNVLQIKTSLIVDGPAAGTAVLSAGGRTGPATFTWCPGQPLPTASFNPACTNVAMATAVHGASMNASIRYQATANQFGGVSQLTLAGGASQVLRVGSVPLPCKAIQLGGPDPSCFAAFSLPAVPATSVRGGPIGAAHIVPAVLPALVHPVGIAGGGTVTSVAPTPVGTFPGNTVRSYGGPWTTGKVTVRAPAAGGGASVFYLQGSDKRVDGVGSISLVAGGVSHRSLAGDDANRSWAHFVVGLPLAVPSISTRGLVLLGALFVVTTTWMVRRAVDPDGHARSAK